MYAKAFGSGFSPVQASSSGSDAGGGWNSVSINGNGTFTLPSLGTYPLPPPGKMEKIPLQDGKFFKIRQRADGSYEGKFGPDSQPAPQQPKAPEHKPAPPPAPKLETSSFQSSPKPKAPEHPAVTAALNFVQTAFQPPAPQQPKAPEHKHFAQTAFQPSPQPKPKAPEHKAPEHKPASSSFASTLTAAVKHAQTAAQSFQPAPAPSSGGWSSVAINRNGTFTLPSIGTFPLPAPGKMEKIPLQDGKFFKIRQRADGAYEGKFGPDSQPAPKQPLPAPKQPLPARLEDRKKDAGGWAQIEVDRDGMIRVPGIAQPLYRPKPGQTDSVPVDARTTFRFRQGADGDVYGTFETKAPSQPPPGWQRVNVDRDGMIRLPNHAQALYRPKPGQTESYQLDARTTFKYSQAEDGEVYGTFETRPASQPPPGWQRVNVDPDGMIRLPGHAKSFYPPQPGKTESIQLDDKTTFTLSQAEDGEVYGTIETAPPPPEDQPGLDVDESKKAFEGVVSTRMVEGKKVVDVGSLGTLVAPAPGGTDAYLLAEDKLLVLDGNADGTVKVSTRKLGIENTSDGFKGALLPPANEKLVFAGRSFEVSKLKNGEKIKKHGEIDGKRFALEVRKNHDGTVTVTGRRDAGILNTVLGWAGKLLPILGTIPGLGVVALAGQVLTVFNAVKGFAQSLKNGNLLGMAGNLAGVVGGLSQGAVQAFASKVANIANVGQQVMTTLKHGLGNGLLQVVSNGANLVSGIAQAAADLGQGAFRSGANNLAQATGTVAGYAGGADSALKGDLQPIVTQVAGDVVRNNPPQVKNPVANPPPVPNPFQGTPPKGTEYSISPQPSPFTQTDPPPLVKAPKDSIVKGPKNPDGKDLFPDAKNPLKWTDDTSPGKPGDVKKDDSFTSGDKKPSIQPINFNGRPPTTVEVGIVAEEAVEAMNRNGNRFYSGLGSASSWAGNIVDNARNMVGVKDKWWKCEDQAPFVADRINRANIPGVRAGVESSHNHSWVVVNVGGKVDRLGNVSGGTNHYIDPWAVGSEFVAQPATPYMTVWDPSMIRSNIEPDGPR